MKQGVWLTNKQTKIKIKIKIHTKFTPNLSQKRTCHLFLGPRFSSAFFAPTDADAADAADDAAADDDADADDTDADGFSEEEEGFWLALTEPFDKGEDKCAFMFELVFEFEFDEFCAGTERETGLLHDDDDEEDDGFGLWFPSPFWTANGVLLLPSAFRGWHEMQQH